MMRLRHPNIVLLIGCTLNPLSIVTEFVERGSAADILKRDPSSLTPARKHVILADGTYLLRFCMRGDADVRCSVARGMVYLHSQTPPIIHRDMKVRHSFFMCCFRSTLDVLSLSLSVSPPSPPPSRKDTTHDETQSANVLITREWNAKIADFGISRPVASDLVMTKRVGTTRWCVRSSPPPPLRIPHPTSRATHPFLPSFLPSFAPLPAQQRDCVLLMGRCTGWRPRF